MNTKRYCLRDPAVTLTDEIICEEIELGESVIDLGCGDGRLLSRLAGEKQCRVLGVELDESEIRECIAKGVPVIKANLDQGLANIPSNSFEYAVLSQTLQQVRHPKLLLSEMYRVSRKAVVVVPNFGHWRVRLQVLKLGRAPVTEALPYEWYNTPNLHVMSLHDFRDLAKRLDYRVVRERPIINDRVVDSAWAANMRAESCLFVLQRVHVEVADTYDA